MKYLFLILSLTVLSLPAHAEEDREHMSVGFNVGTSLPLTFGGTSYSAFPTIGLDFVYKPISWFGFGVSTQDNLYKPNQSSGVLVETALLPQALFFVGDTGFYAGVRAGISSIYDAYTYSGNGTSYALAIGPKIGWQYHFEGSKIAIGPEYTATLTSSSTHSNSNSITSSDVTIPSHVTHNFVFVMKWWLF